MRSLRPAILLGGLAAGLHAAALGNKFVWDDFDHVAAAARPFDLHELIDPRRFRPLLYLPGTFDHLIWGTHPFGWHLTNLLLHGIAVALAVLVLRRLVPENPFAALVGI